MGEGRASLFRLFARQSIGTLFAVFESAASRRRSSVGCSDACSAVQLQATVIKKEISTALLERSQRLGVFDPVLKSFPVCLLPVLRVQVQ